MVRRTFCDICNNEVKFRDFSLKIELNTNIKNVLDTTKLSIPQICESCKDQIINYIKIIEKECKIK